MGNKFGLESAIIVYYSNPQGLVQRKTLEVGRRDGLYSYAIALFTDANARTQAGNAGRWQGVAPGAAASAQWENRRCPGALGSGLTAAPSGREESWDLWPGCASSPTEPVFRGLHFPGCIGEEGALSREREERPRSPGAAPRFPSAAI